MVKEGIVLGHRISKKGIEVDRANFLGKQAFTRGLSSNFQRLHVLCASCLRESVSFILMTFVLRHLVN